MAFDHTYLQRINIHLYLFKHKNPATNYSGKSSVLNGNTLSLW